MNEWRALLDAAERGETVALATVIGVDGSAPRASGARMVVWPDGRIVGTVGGGNFEKRVIEAAIDALVAGQPRRYAVHLTRDLGMCCGGAMEVFIEPQRPLDRLVIYGAGHVARPTAVFAAEAGWAVIVVDERDEWNTAERFPRCTREVADARAHARALVAAVGAKGAGDEAARTWILVVTHDHALDQDLLETLIASDWAWLGLIGSRAKITKFFLRLRAAGVDPARFERVSAPVGLDIGAQTPEEIAVSILAQMVQLRRGKAGAAGAMAIRGVAAPARPGGALR